MTTANKITLTRIAMIPFFIYFAAQPMLIIDETRYLAAFPTSTVIALVLFCAAEKEMLCASYGCCQSLQSKSQASRFVM